MSTYGATTVDFQQVLDQIRAISESEFHKGRLFERLMKTYFQQDPIYQERFSTVWLWSEWAATQVDFDGGDFGIDVVAQERIGGLCAIQCKCYAPETRISKPHLDSFISASARDPFTSRIFVDTGSSWGTAARKTIQGLKPACQVLRFGDLIERPFNWPDLVHDEPESLLYRAEPFSLRPHQQEAFDDVINAFSDSDRGKLIMACGTGKTFVSLRIAEAIAGKGGLALYLVPSISLLQQAMREWAEQRSIPHRYIGICSDTRAGKTDEDATLVELEIPVTTDPDAISNTLRSKSPQNLTVVFCTYQSLPLIEKAQNDGTPKFDIILCDEAHRTTGVDRPNDKTSPFVLVHDERRIKTVKRLYMTATPRLYTASAKSKANAHDVEVFSMDDPSIYGPEFHRIPFSKAVEQDLLSDYKVVVLGISEQEVDVALQAHLASQDSEINISDAAKIVGCWQALQDPENKQAGNEPKYRLHRAIAFVNTIKTSQRLEKFWNDVVEQAIIQLPENSIAQTFQCEVQHVDGQNNALERKTRIDWLKGESNGACKILTNARCLSEGIDVPALDAVLFLESRRSHVDIVQAVGRTMRKSHGKKYGYIILPIAIPVGVDSATALNDNKTYEVVWDVLRALRSHDDRLDAEINQIDLNVNPPQRIIIGGGGYGNGNGSGDGSDYPQLPFPPLDLPPGAIFAKIVEKCGDRKYWENWAKDVAEIFTRVVQRLIRLIENPENADLREWFEAFHGELKISINDAITADSAIDMVAQHILTRPVFEALFESYDFTGSNPVSQALNSLQRDFSEFGLENETRDLERFYESVRLRAQGLDNSEARQRVLMELYEKFFSLAMEKDAARLGIVYTPVEIVDFILASTEYILREQFGRSISDEGVHVLDPFTGTGIFLVRLLQSELLRDADLHRKFREEFHANEIVLLAYYIAAIHIEEAFHGRLKEITEYEPFSGIVLTDTFNLHTERSGFPNTWLPGNSARAERQQELPIQVILGNPPWSAGQRSSADDNPNIDYPEIEARVAETYAHHSNSTNKNSLYDTYKMAIRWASDRIGEQGLIAFVTNGSWIGGNVDSGVRACLEKEFNLIYVLNLRGNQRTQGERSRQEGGKVFGQGSRAPVAISIFVRNPNANHDGCRIHYRDIGDYLNREDKLNFLQESGSIEGIENWQPIKPDRFHDWIGQRSETFLALYPMGTQMTKSGKADDAIFKLYSGGYKTGRDAYTYSFSRETCGINAQNMVNEYLNAMKFQHEYPENNLEKIASLHSSFLKWDSELMNNLRRKKLVTYSNDKIWRIQYRPFVKQYCYVEYVFAQRKYQMDSIFPDAKSENLVICVPGIGSTSPFSVLIVNSMPDLGLNSANQCFPRYRYLRNDGLQRALPLDLQDVKIVDNITDTALKKFRVHYNDNSINKDTIFHYIYGVLHSPQYGNLFADDLRKDLPRIPMASDFHAFAKAGSELAELHLGYEICEEYPLEFVSTRTGKLQPDHFQIGHKKMRYVDDDKSALQINDHVRIEGIPPDAHAYKVNGRTPLEWLIDRYKISTDTKSGILNDPNGWFVDPKDLVSTFRRVVYVGVTTARIIESLPEPF